VISRTKLNEYLHAFLDCARFTDYAPNGLQVEGKAEIKRICTAVTASLEVISQAVALKADALLVHHGYFWKGEEPTITGMKRQRIAKLLQNDMNLFAYHLPLDCHLILGNNSSLAKLLQLSSVQMHKAGSVDNLLWTGMLPKAMSGQELADLIANTIGRTPLYISGHNKSVKSIALCSGGAQDFIADASCLGVDAYLSGEVSERTYYQAQELGINYYSCGHHATERYGIQALGEHLASTYGLEHQFLDSNNPI
jgi:dinuclear metal center YbgI/SA1388 family protein